MIKVATAFSGGLAAPEFALKYSGIEHEIVFACEWDKYARKQYLQFHGKPTTFYEDIKNLCAKCYYALIDLFIFGSPCQNLSLAGNQKGLDGEKSKYFFEGYRVLSEMMPKVFIFENVKGLLSSNKGKDFALVMKMFRDLGYHCAHTVLNTKDYGIPQNRERVFVVGFLDVNAYHDFNFLPGFPLQKRLRDVLKSEVDEKYYLSKKMIDYISTKAHLHQSANQLQNGDECRTLTATDYKCPPCVCVVGMLDMPGHDCIRRVYGVNGVAPTLSTMQGGSQEPKIQIKSATKKGYEVAHVGDSINLSVPNSKTRRGRVGKEVAQTLDTACNQGVVEPRIVAMRGRNPINPKSREAGLETVQMLEPNEQGVSNTLTTVQKDNLVQECDYRMRRLTPKECFRLQGVRDEDINIIVSDTQGYKIAGNAMSIPPVEMIITQIFKPQQIASLFIA